MSINTSNTSNTSNEITLFHSSKTSLTSQFSFDDPLALFADFLRVEDLSNSTLKQYHSVVKSFLQWCIARSRNPITASYLDIIEYRRFLIESKLSKVACNRYLTVVRTFFSCLKTHGYRNDNPTESVKNLRDKSTPASRVKYLTKDQVKALLDLAGGSNHVGLRTRNQAAIVLMAFCGLRGQEVCNIQRKHLDLVKRTLLVNGKGNKTRLIGLTPSQIDYLQALLKTVKDSPDAYLFLSLKGRKSLYSPALQVRGLRVMIDSLLKKLGIKTAKISCHSLRHACGVMLTKEGVSIETIAKQFGHSSINTTRIYTDIVDIVQSPATTVLDKFLA